MEQKPFAIFGTKPDGTLEVCRALPENRGKGRCKHGKHTGLSREQVDGGLVRRFNEKVLVEIHGELNAQRRPRRIPANVTDNHIGNHRGGRMLSRQELLEGAKKVSASFKDEHWQFIQKFYDNIDDKLAEDENHRISDDAASDIGKYLNSDDPEARKTREFLGEDVDVNEFGRIIAFQVRAMTKSEVWRQGKGSVTRTILTSLDNDMTKERYVASVMFFGGRCCYCNAVLRKEPPPGQQASGEHLTPVTPEDQNEIHGGTRYGNMVLACIRCNHERGNQEMVAWMSKTELIPNNEKAAALGRIQAFRNFTLYHEYTREENDRIIARVKELNQELTAMDRDNNFSSTVHKRGLTDAQFQKFQDEIKIALYDLKHNNK